MPAASEPIVVNTGPLLALQACEISHLLVEFHATVLVPDMVLSEILRGGDAGQNTASGLPSPVPRSSP